MEIILGFDLGNGYPKIVGEGLELVFPSGLVLAKETEKLLNGKILDIVKVKSSKDEDNEYYIGKDVEKVGKILTTNVGEGRYKDKYFKLLAESSIAYAISKLVEEPSTEKHNVKLVTGLPSREKSTKQLEIELMKALEGNHIVVVEGVEIVFEVEVLKVIAQPLGTLFNYIFSDDKKYSNLDEKYIGIIDCGTGTTDIDGIQSLVVVDNDRDTIEIGSYTVNQMISDHINKENAYANSTFKTVEQQFSQDSYKISDRAVVPIDEVKERVISNLGEQLTNNISVRWQNFTKFDVIFVTGGSSIIFIDIIKKLIDDVILVENPQMANARGYYKYAMFLNELEETGE